MNIDKKAKIRAVTVAAELLVLAVAIVLSLISYAWLTPPAPSLGSLSRLGKPDPLSVLGPDEEPLSYINFGTADVNNNEGRAQFLFCVFSNTPIDKYDLTLVFTTNTKYNFSLHRAVKSDAPKPEGGYTVEYKGQIVDANYYYQPENINTIAEANGSEEDRLILVNEDPNVSGKAIKSLSDYNFNFNYPATSVDELGLIHDDAVPLVAIANMNAGEDSLPSRTPFAEYFVLEVSWNSDDVPSNSKEIDMVYILAKLSVN